MHESFMLPFKSCFISVNINEVDPKRFSLWRGNKKVELRLCLFQAFADHILSFSSWIDETRFFRR